MNRKLHNTLAAVVATSAVLVLGLIAATPITPALDPMPASIELAMLDAGLDPDAFTADHGMDSPASAEPATRRHAPRGHRQSVAMPFFSFAPRG